MAAVAAEQYGAFSRAQAEAAGLSKEAIEWRLRSGDWCSVFRNAYRFSMTEATPNLLAKAALLAAPEAVLSHLTAARLYGLQVEKKDTIDLLVKAPRTISWQGVDAHQTKETIRFVEWNGLRRTLLADTMLDLTDVLEDEALEIALDSALRRFKGAREWIQGLIKETSARRRGIAVLKEMMAVRAEGRVPESPLETKLFRKLRLAGVPLPTCQYDIYDARGFVMRVDLAFVRHRVALHGDGWQFHNGRAQFDKDAEQRRRLAALGWLQLPLTYAMLESPAFVEDVMAALRSQEPQLKLFTA